MAMGIMHCEIMKAGLRLIIDGVGEEVVRLALETRIINMERRALPNPTRGVVILQKVSLPSRIC